jgi:hypothetical protein
VGGQLEQLDPLEPAPQQPKWVDPKGPVETEKLRIHPTQRQQGFNKVFLRFYSSFFFCLSDFLWLLLVIALLLYSCHTPQLAVLSILLHFPSFWVMFFVSISWTARFAWSAFTT